MKIAIGWLTTLAVVQASFDANQSSYINVQIPQHLHTHNVSGGKVHRRAQFGAHWDLWKQDGHMLAVTHYVEGTLCDMPNSNITKTFGEPPFLLLADLGGCTPVSKARRAQELGAAGLILSSHHCLCDEHCDFEDKCEERLPYLKDDGSGGSITIPTMLIGKGNATHIISALHKKEPVLMEMAWQTPRMDHTVTLDLWYTPSHSATADFLANFSTLALILQDHLDFRLHHYILDGTKLQCHGNAEDPGTSCYNMCTNHGRYCATSGRDVHGKDVVKEALRRICLQKHHPASTLWDYLNHFHTLCQSGDFFANGDCIKDVYKHSNIKEDVVEDCMKDSGDIEKDDENTLLAEIVRMSESVLEYPTLSINELPFHWPLQTKFVFESFCRGFVPGHAPHVCYACGYCGDPVACAGRTPMHCDAHDGEIPEPSKSSTQKQKKNKKGGFWKFVLVVFILAGIGGVVYYKKYMEDGPGLSGYTLGQALLSDSA